MNVLSLFDGISCGRIALDRAGISVDKYYASEIEKSSMQISEKNYPDIVQLGDATKWKDWDIDWSSIDLLFAGFPCQAWSMAGKQEGDKDIRGMLLWTMLDILENIKKHNPNVKFLFENVFMKQEFMDYVNNAIGVRGFEINSSLVSAQSRKRMYWTNFYITQPEDKKIYVKDIMQPEEEVDEKFYLNRIKEIDWYINIDKLKEFSETINVEAALESRSLPDASTKYYQNPVLLIKFRGSQGYRCHCINGKTPTLVTNGGGYGRSSGLYLVGMRGKCVVDGKRLTKNLAGKTKQTLDTRLDGKTNTLTTVEKDNCLIIDYNNEYYRIRRLTPIECERLQTVPDNYTFGVSDTKRCSALGNGWTVDVIAHILTCMKNDLKDPFDIYF